MTPLERFLNDIAAMTDLSAVEVGELITYESSDYDVFTAALGGHAVSPYSAGEVVDAYNAGALVFVAAKIAEEA